MGLDTLQSHSDKDIFPRIGIQRSCLIGTGTSRRILVISPKFQLRIETGMSHNFSYPLSNESKCSYPLLAFLAVLTKSALDAARLV